MCFIKYLRMREQLLSNPMAFFAANRLAGVRVPLQSASGFMGRWTVFSSFVLLPVVVVLAWRQKSLLLLLMVGGILYQAAINVLAYNMASYTANMYFFHLTNLSVGAIWLWQCLVDQRRVKAEK
ncbi:MAG: hypothetical protein A3G35_08710 [candidate division NC10 bacterium RIFCSPLOWO2_12_FULL_66_18]|nr:MAG: hypothetical protein A3G35_08710 [candidate division NC10 bacterium RIFCSPLOWO2_12_FULL_66_18]